MIAAAIVTSRAVVAILFGTVVAVWAVVGVPLLYGRILVLARVVFHLFGTFLPIHIVVVVVKRDFCFLTMTIVHTAPPKFTKFTP